MAKETQVTILIGCYRQEKYLPDAIWSAESQVPPSCEKDKTMPSFVVEYFVDKEGVGASVARNAAIKKVQTPFILLLDADDMMPSHYLYYLWHRLIFNSSGLSMHADPYKIVTAPMQFFGDIRMDRIGEVELKSIKTERLFNHFPMGISCLFSKLAFDKVGGFDEVLKALEDKDLWIRMANHAGCKILNQPKTFLLRREVPDSLSHTVNAKEVIAAFNAKHGTALVSYRSNVIPPRSVSLLATEHYLANKQSEPGLQSQKSLPSFGMYEY